MRKIIIICLVMFTLGIGHNFALKKWFKGYCFETKVGTYKHGYPREYLKSSNSYIRVSKGDEYLIFIKNPLPVTVGVVVSVDGLNVIDGKRTTPSKSSKWILKPYSSMKIRGWQTGKKALRRFYFTDAKNSYAKWKEEYDHKIYTQNLGVIGVAYFWDKNALTAALNPPKPFAESESYNPYSRKYKGESKVEGQTSKKAGTGMGRHENNPVKQVNFHFNTGMYSNRNVLKIYYEFEQCNPPQPFDDDTDDFAPEMNRIIRKIFRK